MKLDHSLITNIVMAEVKGWDYPDFADAYVESAHYHGRPMTQEELEAINEDGDFVNEQAHASFH